MADKTTFSDLIHPIDSGVAPDLKCCANCLHARNRRTDPISHAHLVTCKALPPTALGVPIRDNRTGEIGVQIKAYWPNLLETEECDYFHPKTGLETDPKTG